MRLARTGIFTYDVVCLLRCRTSNIRYPTSDVRRRILPSIFGTASQLHHKVAAFITRGRVRTGNQTIASPRRYDVVYNVLRPNRIRYRTCNIVYKTILKPSIYRLRYRIRYRYDIEYNIYLLLIHFAAFRSCSSSSP